MKKILLSITMLITIVIQSQTLEENLPGIYSSTKNFEQKTHVVILYDKEAHYYGEENWTIFSLNLKEGHFKRQTIIEITPKFIKTRLSFKPHVNYEDIITYSLQGTTMYAKFEGYGTEIYRFEKYKITKN